MANSSEMHEILLHLKNLWKMEIKVLVHLKNNGSNIQIITLYK